jgi:hypothetical protein
MSGGTVGVVGGGGRGVIGAGGKTGAGGDVNDGSTDASAGAAGAAPDAGAPGGGDATVNDAGHDAAYVPEQIVEAYTDGTYLDVRIAVGTGWPGGSLFYVEDARDARAGSGPTPVVIDKIASWFFLRVVLDGYYEISLDPCSYVTMDEKSGVLRFRIPLTYVDFEGTMSVSTDFTGAPKILPTAVSALPPFAGVPLCPAINQADIITAPGAYSAVYSAFGFIKTMMCALTTAGEPKCWGDHGVAPVPKAGPFVEFGPRAGSLCGLRPTGSLDCWVLPDLAFAGMPDSSTLVYKQISETGDCGLLDSGDVVCGDNDSPEKRALLVQGPLASVSGTTSHGCALHLDGSLSCWGFGERADSPATPVERLDGKYDEVRVAYVSTVCARRGGIVDCVLPGRKDVIRLDGASFVNLTSEDSLCALDERGTPTCLGSGMLGVPPLPYRALSIGEYVGAPCGILKDGRLVCFTAGSMFVFP